MSSSLRGRPSAFTASTIAWTASDRSNASSERRCEATARTKASRRRKRACRMQWSLLSARRRIAVVVMVVIFFFFLSMSLLDAMLGTNKNSGTFSSALSMIRVDETEFSVIINTYKRPQMLTQAVQHYAQRCGRRTGVKQVFVIWAEQDNSPPDPASFFLDSNDKLLKGSANNAIANRSSVQIIKAANSLNSRFLPIPQMTTTAVFMVDDDVQVDCASLAQGFTAWKAFPHSMVGYYPRLASPPRGTSAEAHGYIEHCWPIVFLTQRVNFILTKASFLHRRYLDIYSSKEQHPQEIKDYVDHYMNCEDIAMALLVANVTRQEDAVTQQPAMPVYVQGSISDQGLFNGISTGGGFVGRRAKCLTDVSRIYKQKWGVSPFDTTFKVQDASWTRHFPGFWWQHRPSNPFEWGALLDFFQ